MLLLHKPHKKRRVGAKRDSPLFSLTTTPCSTTDPTVKSLYQCGRWSLRCTKSRQDRVCVTAPCNKRKRSLQSADHSSSGENELPSTAKQTAKPQTEEVTECGNCSREFALGSENDAGSVCKEAFPTRRAISPQCSIRDCLSVLDGLEGIDPDQYNKALLKFMDERPRLIFILIPVDDKVSCVVKVVML